MANSYLDKNGLLYLWQKITGKFVAKETGKGLSSNDYTTTEKEKLTALPGIKQIGTGLELTEQGTLNATGGGTASAVAWENVTDKPSTLAGYGITDAAAKDHNHDDKYLKLSGGQMTGPIQFSPDQGQIAVDAETAAAKIEMDTTAAEIIYTDKTASKTNRMTVSAEGAEIVVGEAGSAQDAKIKLFKSGVVHVYSGAQNALEVGPNGLNVLNKNISHVATPVDNDHAANKGYVDSAVAGKANSADVYQKTEVYNKTEIDGKLSSTYKPGGNMLFENLPDPSASNLGLVYSMNDAFTTDDRFIASEPTQYPIGTNVVCVQVTVEDTPTYLYDVLAGFVDLSGYMQKTDMVAITNEEIDQIVGDSVA